jgi:hypothetical protein
MGFLVVVVDKKTSAIKGYYNGVNFSDNKAHAIVFKTKDLAVINAGSHRSTLYNVGVIGSTPKRAPVKKPKTAIKKKRVSKTQTA